MIAKIFKKVNIHDIQSNIHYIQSFITWKCKGIYVLNDILNDPMEMLSQDEKVEFFGIRTNLLGYGLKSMLF